MKQLTQEQAVAFFDSAKHESMTDDEIVDFQLYQECLCLPFDRLVNALCVVLGRPVFDMELAGVERIRAEHRLVKGKATDE